MAWSSPGLSLKGQRGSQIIYTNGAPKASDGFDGDGAIDVTNGRLYAQKQNGAWPTTYASLIGPAGASIRLGSGAPTNSTFGNDNDLYIDTTATNGPVLYGPRANGAWPTSGTSLAGAAGLSVLSGTSAPTASDGVVGQPAFLNTATGQLYGQKTSSGWPSTPVSLVGPKGSQFYADTAPPGLQLGTVGDFFFQSNTFQLYIKITNAAAATTADYPNGWKVVGNLKGAAGADSTVPGPKGDKGDAGAAGLSVVSGAAAPTANDGVVGSPAFINTAAGTLYGAKTASGWPSAFLSLIGQQGPSGATIYTGSGAPTSSSPANPVAGSIYIDSSTQPYRLYGPYTTANNWPTSYIAMGGGSFLQTSGPPAAALGAVGDIAIDTTNALFYPPKTATGWTATPINLVGPTGAPGATTSYRATMRGSYWSGASSAPAAGTWYPVLMSVQTAGTASTGVPLAEVMPAAGSLTILHAASAAQGAGATPSSLSFQILKNGTVIATVSALYTTSQTLVTGKSRILASGLTFAADDIISINVASGSAGNSTHCNVSLAYTTNS